MITVMYFSLLQIDALEHGDRYEKNAVQFLIQKYPLWNIRETGTYVFRFNCDTREHIIYLSYITIFLRIFYFQNYTSIKIVISASSNGIFKDRPSWDGCIEIKYSMTEDYARAQPIILVKQQRRHQHL